MAILIVAVFPSRLSRYTNQKWIADFTYIWTAEGWFYVSAVIELFSRRVVGLQSVATTV